jgi:hypothetical protein
MVTEHRQRNGPSGVSPGAMIKSIVRIGKGRLPRLDRR